MAEAESEVFRTIQLDYVMPADADWDGFEQKAIDGFVDAVEAAGGEMESASAGPYRPEPERTELEAAELEPLRGIARRLADGWVPLPPHRSTRQPGWWRLPAVGGSKEWMARMTAAEVEAIYGQGENESDGE